MNISAQLRKRGGQQEGINMVDLMMWLVIAALLLAAAIQGIGYYQKAAYLYQMQSDLEGAGTVTTGMAANNNGVIDKALAEKGVAEANKSAGITTTVELAADGKTPYLRGVHPGVDDKDVLYLFDACADTYKIGVNVVPKGGTPALEACGISAAPPSGGSTGGSSGTPTADDIDGDGIPNASDPDIDGDGIPNAEDPTPNGETGGTGGSTPPAGGSFALAAWGGNSYGQFGNGTTDTNWSPSIVGGATNFSTIDAGAYHVCGISSGKAYCWGQNTSGQLGIGSSDNASAPTLVGALADKTVTDISAGLSHTCAVADAAVYCWGSNYLGKSNGTADPANPGVTINSPTLVNNGVIFGVKMRTVEAEGERTCAVSIDGNAYCWGSDYALGNGAPRDGTNWSAPVAVTGGLKFTSKITGSHNYACGIAGGDVYCWGTNDYGRVGNGGADREFNASPSKVIGLPAGKVTVVSGGDTTACAIADGGKAYCWGANWGGQVGNGSTLGYDTPPSFTAVAVDTSGVLNGVALTSMSSYMDMTCATEGTGVYCWGEGPGGDGMEWGNDYYSPVTATGAIVGKSIKQVAVGNYFTSMLVQ